MQTMADPIIRAALTAPDGTAVVCGEVNTTFAETMSRCKRLIGYMRSLGLKTGDRVMIISKNCHRYVESYLAIPAGGFVIVPINTRSTDKEIAYAVTDSGARLLITDMSSPGITPEITSMFDHVLKMPDGYETALAQSEEAPFAEGVSEDTVAGIFYTSGTTGAAKGVMLTHRNLIANAWTTFTWGRLTEDDRWLLMAPMFHAAGTIAVLATTWLGATQVVLPAFDPAKALDLIEQEHVTSTLAVPTMLIALIEEQLAKPRDVSSLRLMSHGAAPIATEVLVRAHKVFPDAELLHLYGTTETSPIAVAMPHEERLLGTPRASSCGQPAIGVQVKVVSSNGMDLPPGQVGEVHIRGANVMQGYWRKPDETRAVLKNGWYSSGDLGYMDDHGYLFLVDRLKDMIVTGGENVYSTEVEEVLYAHPMVLEAAVFGVPHPRWGEAVHAVVVPRGEVTADELMEHCRSRLASFKVPKEIEIRREPLPKSASGKLLKRELREPYWAGHATRIGQYS
ncbi:MAG: long-chain-fatty-acid--CoA ligase [Actinobacteria bacterium]|jgi:long-chain acyl-CoA synthetase|nr:long-chain-fatty-acid--CoA ligase [Actinomycetota bacterium]MCL6095453.1 long-chain-fatty-acid--CoA ligase [Actinomycetota bacterium]